MAKRIIFIAFVLVAAGSAVFWFFGRRSSPTDFVLFGNVDLRQINLAFNASERIDAVLVEEGSRVRKGEVLARLDMSRIKPQVAQAEAQAAVQQANVERLRNGSRPQEVAQGRANLVSAQADALNARQQYERQSTLIQTAATSRQTLDQAKAATDVADAKVDAAQKSLDLLIAGPRREDVAQGEAQLRASEAQHDYMKRQLADAELRAPADAIVRSRLMEPGEMAAPTRPVFSLAVLDPKWVRAYVSEPQLGRLHPGMRAVVTIDGFPDRPLAGRVGFISPVAEFTPKTVQTEDLRTSLVYEVRIITQDPDNILRVGMPATVRLPSDTSTGAVPAASR
jgi:HlyD family secretion protein